MGIAVPGWWWCVMVVAVVIMMETVGTGAVLVACSTVVELMLVMTAKLVVATDASAW